jgi:hypothetical protein
MFKPTSIPVYFSEYGCNIPIGTPRVFDEVGALYGPNMTGLNGGLVYEYSQEADNYGLVVIGSNNVTLRQDYDNLQGQYNKLNLNLLEQVPNVSNSPPSCTTTLVNGASGLNNSWVIPPQPPGTADLINNGVPNAINGKIVPVTNFNVQENVYDVNGNLITGLVLNQVSGSNVPGGQNTTSGKTGKKNVGVALQAETSMTLLAVLAMAVATFL